MSKAAFFGDDAKKRAADAVKAVEALTSAEVVVAVRERSGDYRAADYHVGFIAMAAMLLYTIVAPSIFTPGDMAIAAVVAFALGTFTSANVGQLRRALVRDKKLAANVESAARATFYELGISKTSGRNGILVFVSAFERMGTVVPDVGVDPAALGEEYQAATRSIAEAARRLDLEAFLTAVQGLGPALGKTMPRQEGDVNELPDEIQ